MYSTNQRRIIGKDLLEKLGVTDQRRFLTSGKLTEPITRYKLTKIKDILTAGLQQIASSSDGTTYKSIIEDPGDDNRLTWIECLACIVAAKSNFLALELIAIGTYELCNSDYKDTKKDVKDAQGLQITVNQIFAGIFPGHVLKLHNNRATGLSNAIPFDIFNNAWNGAIGVLLPKMLKTMSHLRLLTEPTTWQSFLRHEGS